MGYCDSKKICKLDGLSWVRDNLFECIICKKNWEVNSMEQKQDKTIEFGSNCETCNRLCKDKCTCKSDRESQEFDIVEKPYHYNVGIEVDTFLDSWNMNHRQANIVKYVTRYPYKDPTKRVQDLKKARWYLDRLIGKEELREKKESNASTK